MNKLHFTGTDLLISGAELSADLREALEDCGASGDASEAVAYVIGNFEITGDVDACSDFLKGYGAWDASERQDHDVNLQRLVWLAGCDLCESNEIYFAGY